MACERKQSKSACIIDAYKSLLQKNMENKQKKIRIFSCNLVASFKHTELQSKNYIGLDVHRENSYQIIGTGEQEI